MRLEFDEQGYVCCILYGCSTGSCVEYTGLVPTQPEEYKDIDDWADRAQTQAYKLDSNGNLTYDEERAAALQKERTVRDTAGLVVDLLGAATAISTSTNTEFTLYTAEEDGLYGVSFTASWASNADGIRACFLKKPNDTYLAASRVRAGGTGAIQQNVFAYVYLNAGESIKGTVWQNSGASLNLSYYVAQVVKFFM